MYNIYIYIVCVCVYVHTFYVLIKPPIPYYVLAAVFASCFYVLFKFCFMREGTQGPPLVTS